MTDTATLTSIPGTVITSGDHGIVEGFESDVPVDDTQFFAMEVEVTEQGVDAALLICGERLLAQPTIDDLHGRRGRRAGRWVRDSGRGSHGPDS